MSNRLEDWKRAAHAAVELFGSPPHGIVFARRDEIETPAIAGAASSGVKGEVLGADREREPLTLDPVPLFERIRKAA